MCEALTGIYNFLSAGACNFVSGSWEQAKIIAGLGKQILFCSPSGVSERFSKLNLAGKISAVLIGAVVVKTVYNAVHTCAGQTSDKRQKGK